jgi:hypothetical protein
MTIEPATEKDTEDMVSISIANQDDSGLFQEPEADASWTLKDGVNP